jgi:uridylate kinase
MSGDSVGNREVPVVEPASLATAVYDRVLIKLSGEALMGSLNFGIDPPAVEDIARQIKEVHQLGVEVAIVVGGGNMIRGANVVEAGWDRATGDYMGMLATVINALALQNSLEKMGIFTRVLSAIHMAEVAEPFIRRRAIRHLEKKRVVIFAGGTGNPYFTTDTAAALRAMEIRAQVIIKATKVDGVYDRDPVQSEDAVRFEELTYFEVLKQNLKVMDATAIALCSDNELPIIVLNLFQRESIRRAVLGQKVGSLIRT